MRLIETFLAERHIFRQSSIMADGHYEDGDQDQLYTIREIHIDALHELQSDINKEAIFAKSSSESRSVKSSLSKDGVCSHRVSATRTVVHQ